MRREKFIFIFGKYKFILYIDYYIEFANVYFIKPIPAEKQAEYEEICKKIDEKLPAEVERRTQSKGGKPGEGKRIWGRLNQKHLDLLAALETQIDRYRTDARVVRVTDLSTMGRKMSRNEFIESQGATCRNWRWSWSYINEKKKIIIFGAWDYYTKDGKTLILSDEWEISRIGRKQAGYGEAREHIRMIEEEGYELMTFVIKYSDVSHGEDGKDPAKIKDFDDKLEKKFLEKGEEDGDKWYAVDEPLDNLLPEEIRTPQQYIEGALKKVTINSYERNSAAREKCIEHYGYTCSVCDFDFFKVYGKIGKQYIHVHHIIPLAKKGEEYELDPIKDLIPVCPNCHSMIHRKKTAMSVEELKEHLNKRHD